MYPVQNRRFRLHEILSIAALSLAVGCSCGDDLDDSGGQSDGGGPDASTDGTVDAASIDAPFCSTPEPNTFGGACTADADCVALVDAGAAPFCLDDRGIFPTAWPAEGFCTVQCSASAECGEGATCALLPDGAGGTFGACMPSCCDGINVGDTCEPGRICQDTLFGDEIMTEACVPGTRGAADGDACETFEDCDRNSGCRDDRFQNPGGYCSTFACESDDDCASGGDGRCVDLSDQVLPICVDACDSDADCRQDEGYKCIDRGPPVGKFCAHPAPGDACTVDLDCGLPDAPSPTEQWACREGLTYPGGYCTVEECNPANNNTCPIFSFCVGLVTEADTFCADECATPGGNECGVGYDCIVVDTNGSPGTVRNRNVCLPTGSVVDEPSQI